MYDMANRRANQRAKWLDPSVDRDILFSFGGDLLFTHCVFSETNKESGDLYRIMLELQRTVLLAIDATCKSTAPR